MRLRTIAVAAVVGLIASIAPATAAEAAKKPVYKVSIKIGKTSADVHQNITVVGRVKGPKAAKKRLVVQRKVGAGKWTNVRKVRTNKVGRYATKVKVATAGQQYLRVVAPKSKKARAGVSSRRGYVGWRWLDLTVQPSQTEGDGAVKGPATIAGTTYPKAITFENTGTYFNTAGVCDIFKSTAGVVDGGTPSGTVLALMASDYQLGSETDPRETSLELTAGQAPQPFRASLRDTRLFAFGSVNGRIAVVSPLAHCTVNALPAPSLGF
ncbi:hypothetical protein [Aeromicrobium sp.]|uniref:hypothetical protein n=1 Tax=Aeromicrobium sp. TaxID=1871063 RepID=UPI0028AB3A3F|nr:hypothetical protein [Aeromicrobium sp.]